MEEEYILFTNPPRSVWSCHIAGITYTPDEGKEPNFFWRWMQYLCFGANWKRNDR